MGVVAADELVQNTNPYYRSAYVLAFRADEADRFGDLDSPLMQLARIGVVAGTPVADLLVRKGLMAQAHPYQLLVDTRVEHPAQKMIEDLAAGEIDAALLWGPIAGYWAEQADQADHARAADRRSAHGAAPGLSHLDGHAGRTSRSGSTTSTA